MRVRALVLALWMPLCMASAAQAQHSSKSHLLQEKPGAGTPAGADAETANSSSSTETPSSSDSTETPDSSGSAEAPSSSGSADSETSGTSEDLAELERALAADAAEQTSQNPGAVTPSWAADRSPAASAASPPPGVVARTFQSLNPQISFIADMAAAYFSADDPLMSGGHDPTENGFNLQQLELAVSSMVDPYFRFDANLVFSQFGVEIEEVYATTLALPWNLQVRAGQFLTRFGRINNTHPHTWSFVDQMLVLGKFFGGESNRGLGLEVSTLLPLPWYLELLGSITDASGEATARSFWGGDDPGVESMADFQYTLAAKQFFPLSDDLSLFWGLSAALGPNPTGRDNRTEIFGTDLYFKYRPISRASYTTVSLDVEWLVRRRQVPEDVLQDHGLYAFLFYRFAKRWAVAGRYEYVTGLADDYLDPTWTEVRQRASGNLTFWPTEFSRLRLQYNYDRPNWRAGYSAVFLAAEFSVGAHGAHKF